MDSLTQTLLAEIGQSFGHDAFSTDSVTVSGEGVLSSAFPVSELATACWAAGLPGCCNRIAAQHRRCLSIDGWRPYGSAGRYAR